MTSLWRSGFDIWYGFTTYGTPHELAGWRVARRGDYRVTFRVLDDDHALLIGRVEHRAHIYRPT